ncbi:hypothetical protein [uncultured Olleya sp.]|uniref:hypothetical protein n=1 Tax=uncultured Olleya sp. TaxID=757243 RepID=UPI002597CF57|nr:hypothetical protein [uncultured Olleya sp.]
MLDKYFNYPLLIDTLLSVFAYILCLVLLRYSIIILPSTDLLLSTTSDIANVSFTSAGFVLTFLTLLVSFKSSKKPFKKNKNKSLEDNYKDETLFNLFLSSNLYNETIRHLKNGVKELIIVAIIGYTLKLTLPIKFIDVLFYFNICGLVLIALVLWRCLLVLSGVLKVQNINEEQ